MKVLMTEVREALLMRRSRLRGRGDQGQRELQELRDIDEALARMTEGVFGHCSRCGGAIGRYRLRAVPEARYCLTCSGLVVR